MSLAAFIAELVVVVVGILIALALNDWNDRRIQRRREQAYLESLRHDTRADIETLQFQIAFTDGTAEAARTLLRIFRSEEKTPEENRLLRLLKRAGTMYPFRPTKTTFQELVGGGNLAVIQSRDVLRAVIAYYAAAEFPQEAIALAIRRIWIEYYDALSASIDPTLIPRMTLDIFDLLRQGVLAPADAPSDRGLPSLGIGDLATGGVKKSEELERALAMVLDSAVLVRESLKDLREAATRLLEQLEQYGGRKR